MSKVKVDLENPLAEGVGPWDLMKSFESQHFDAEVFNPKDQRRWANAMIDGGLPYMWRKAYVVLDMVYGLCQLQEGSRVFLIGEGLEGCGFLEDIQKRIGANGELDAIDIQSECRKAMFEGKTGRHGQRGTFRYDYCRDVPDNTYDAVLNLQAVQHADDWSEAGAEFVRILKPGRPLVMAEIILGGPEQVYKIKQDLHLDHLITKIMSGIGTKFEDFPYHSPSDLKQAFEGQLEDMKEFEWCGLEVFWGRKPVR